MKLILSYSLVTDTSSHTSLSPALASVLLKFNQSDCLFEFCVYFEGFNRGLKRGPSSRYLIHVHILFSGLIISSEKKFS